MSRDLERIRRGYKIFENKGFPELDTIDLTLFGDLSKITAYDIALKLFQGVTGVLIPKQDLRLLKDFNSIQNIVINMNQDIYSFISEVSENIYANFPTYSDIKHNFAKQVVSLTYEIIDLYGVKEASLRVRKGYLNNRINISDMFSSSDFDYIVGEYQSIISVLLDGDLSEYEEDYYINDVIYNENKYY